MSAPTDSATTGIAADAQAAGGDAAGSGRRRRQRLSPTARRWLLVALLVLAALLAAATAVFAVQVRQHNQLEQARAEAVRAARQSAINLTSISAQNFDAATQQILDGSTSTFKQEFEANSKNLKSVLADNKVQASGEVLNAGLVRSDLSSATALVVVNATVSNVQVPEGRVNTYRMQIEVDKVGGRWLTSSLKFVG